MKVVTEYLAWTGLAAISTTEAFIPAGPWQSAANLTGVKGWGELRGKTGNFQCKPAVQVANDVRSPGASTGAGSALTADGVSDPNAVNAVNSAAVKFVRVGWLVALTSGSTLAWGGAGGVVELIYGS